MSTDAILCLLSVVASLQALVLCALGVSIILLHRRVTALERGSTLARDPLIVAGLRPRG